MIYNNKLPMIKRMHATVFKTKARNVFVADNDLHRLTQQYRQSMLVIASNYKKNLELSLKAITNQLNDNVDNMNIMINNPATSESNIFNLITRMELNTYDNILKLEKDSYMHIVAVENGINKTMKAFVNELCRNIQRIQ